MKKSTLTSCLLFLTLLCSRAQVPVPVPAATATEQQLETMTENNEDLETEDDFYLQHLDQLRKNPENINHADENFLQDLRLLTPMQVHNFLAYRSLVGKFISIYELQAIPGWDISTIQKVRPFLEVVNEQNLFYNIRSGLRNGDHTILLRLAQTLEKSRGYLPDSSTGKNYYRGSPQRLLVRYKYNYKNLLQYGAVGEKDAGEEFFKGAQTKGFDFYSAHFFVRNAGAIKAFALGDFTVNMGQGLTQWMSLGFKKGPDLISVKRQSAVLKPYNATGEIYFHRGAGITVGKNNWQATVFGSLRKLDANFNADTSSNRDNFVSALQTSGLHRTSSEVDDKGIQRQVAFGGNFSYRLKRMHVGLNAIAFKFKYPLVKAAEPYNLYALSGKSPGNYSTDYSYTYKNMHFFGEAAMSNKKYAAFVNGLLISVANQVDMSFFYRNISKGYQSLYTNAYTENTLPTNEKGFFTGITVHPHSSCRIEAYADIYRFPWLRFRVNKPVEGTEYMIQLNYKPNRQLEIYSRYKAESRLVNSNPDLLTFSPVTAQPRKNLRTHLAYKINASFIFRTRFEIAWFDKEGPAEEQGFLMYAELHYKPVMKTLSGNLRLQYFETGGYNSRLYAYENDVLYSFSIPVFHGKGHRYYLNVNYDLSKKISLWARWAQYIYTTHAIIGSGLDEIRGPHKTEVKLQLMYKF